MTPLKAALISCTLAAILAAFTLGGDFVMEEKNVVIEGNLAIRDLSNIPGFFAGSWIEEGLGRNYYRPVVTTLYTLEYAIFGLDPLGWHLVNVLLYALCALAVCLLISEISGQSWVGLAGGLLFAIHPVHVEPAAVVSYQTTLLAGLFTTVGLLNFERYLKHPTDKKRLVILGLCAALGAMSKEEAFVLPLLMAPLALIFRPAGWQRSALWGFLVTVPILTAIFVIRAVSVDPIEVTFFAGQPASTVVFTMLGVVVRYLELLLVPLRLCPFYDWFIVPFEHQLSYKVALGISVLLMAITVAVVSLRTKRNHIALGISWLFLALIPVSQIFPFVVVTAERYLFIPTLGWSLLIGFLVVQLVQSCPAKRKVPSIVACGLIAVALSARFVVRTQDWKNDFTLNSATVRDFPQTPTPHLNLARLYENRGDLPSAERELLAAIELVPAWELPRQRLEELRSR